MKIELTTNLCPIIIPDTYGTRFQYEPIDDWIRFKNLMVNKAEEYIRETLDEIDIPYENLKMGKFNSPTQYNYGTDWIDFELEIPDDYIEDIRENVREYEAKEFFEFAENKFGSYDGFYSFYPYTSKEFYSCKGKDEYILAMWIIWLIKDNDDMDLQEIHHDYLDEVWEYANANGYVLYEED